ncbi:MAG: relaxase/mobilization nuclease domain-containing protein [Clostridia bacterium]
MAVTKIWPVRGRLDHPIDYAMNPEKTDAKLALGSLEDVMNYAVNEEKTEKKFYVSGINCTPEIARSEFQIVKEQFAKPGGIIAYHAYQSFSESEVTPKEAHTIGKEFAKRVWGDSFQVVVATHLNTHCLHNHFVVNSVSFKDGKRCRQKQWTELSKISDEICKEHQLNIVERHGKGLPQPLAKAEREGAPTRLNIAKEALDDAIAVSCNLRELQYHMTKMGYLCQFDRNRKYWTIRQREWKRPIRMARMGDAYTNEAIREKLHCNQSEVRKSIETQRRCTRSKSVKLKQKPKKKIGGLRGLYYHYCYLLGYYPRKQKAYQISPLLRDDLTKLNYISQEIRLLQKYQIDTMEQLLLFEKSLSGQLIQMRKEVETLPNEMRARREAELKACRQQLRLCRNIAQRSIRITDKIRQIEREKRREERKVQREIR